MQATAKAFIPYHACCMQADASPAEVYVTGRTGRVGSGQRIEIRLVCINVISNRHRQGGLWDVLSGRAALYQRQLFAPVSASICLPLTSLTKPPCFTAPYRPALAPSTGLQAARPPREASDNIATFRKDRGCRPLIGVKRFDCDRWLFPAQITRPR
jgi:hypothetical protein